MLKTLSYPLSIEPCSDEGGYLAVFPTLPGCQTWGETYESAVRNAEEALAVYIETLAANGDPIPETGQIDRPVTLGVMVRADIAA
ncbi:type II toxin-antitoxin system HicB family antitoxin [Methylocystis sp. JR02]|uniref:type II toxin-antitoxin system HicB family antitoxin n=1 Tax=Methylocystis sp. JR02 TaxID=3046284 RepID=UPI0024B9C5F7|nr:type II toxin-antitoxin system HicB family antitoxin [Methylocystis sp. JR02]MDJ0449358.1 type II toxin-antitoxin system HicB family antitoxin [Methylocystis sp. JR02]